MTPRLAKALGKVAKLPADEQDRWAELLLLLLNIKHLGGAPTPDSLIREAMADDGWNGEGCRSEPR